MTKETISNEDFILRNLLEKWINHRKMLDSGHITESLALTSGLAHDVIQRLLRKL